MNKTVKSMSECLKLLRYVINIYRRFQHFLISAFSELIYLNLIQWLLWHHYRDVKGRFGQDRDQKSKPT